MPVIGESTRVALLSIYFKSLVHTENDYQGDKAVDALVEKSRKERLYSDDLHKSVYEQNASVTFKRVNIIGTQSSYY